MRHTINAMDFIEMLRSRKDTLALVIACSGRKRPDSEICSEIRYLRNASAALSFKQTSINFDDNTARLIESFRRCTEKEHPGAIKSSKDYPAFLRYNGEFYKAVWECGKTSVWKKVVSENWKVLILSAYYGFLRVTDPIKDYNLQMHELKAECKSMLPQVLQRIKNANGIETIYFLTSNNYTSPFRGKLRNVYQVRLFDDRKKPIYGAYARDYYREAGYLFASIVSGEARGSASFVKLEVI